MSPEFQDAVVLVVLYIVAILVFLCPYKHSTANAIEPQQVMCSEPELDWEKLDELLEAVEQAKSKLDDPIPDTWEQEDSPEVLEAEAQYIASLIPHPLSRSGRKLGGAALNAWLRSRGLTREQLAWS